FLNSFYICVRFVENRHNTLFDVYKYKKISNLSFYVTFLNNGDSNNKGRGVKQMQKSKLFGIMAFLFGMVFLLSACGGGGKNIAIGPPASETNSASKLILEAYDVGEDDFKSFQEGFGDAAYGVHQGNIGVSFG